MFQSERLGFKAQSIDSQIIFSIVVVAAGEGNLRSTIRSGKLCGGFL